MTSKGTSKGSETVRKWKTPKVVEIAVGMEINCYACATL
jgi:coenzyme PQQ precursor peptide PqqA